MAYTLMAYIVMACIVMAYAATLLRHFYGCNGCCHAAPIFGTIPSWLLQGCHHAITTMPRSHAHAVTDRSGKVSGCQAARDVQLFLERELALELRGSKVVAHVVCGGDFISRWDDALAVVLRCSCHVIATSWPCDCHAIAVLLSCFCHVITTLLI